MVLLLFAMIAAASWQSSLGAQVIVRVGVTISDLPATEGHTLAVNVRSETSAARAGILAKDVIFQLDGEPVRRSTISWVEWLGSSRATLLNSEFSEASRV